MEDTEKHQEHREEPISLETARQLLVQYKKLLQDVHREVLEIETDLLDRLEPYFDAVEKIYYINRRTKEKGKKDDVHVQVPGMRKQPED